jgi:hypothetical protein
MRDRKPAIHAKSTISKESIMIDQPMTRREALKAAAAIGVTAALSRFTKLAAAPAPAPATRPATTIGIATSPAPFIQKDLDKLLDDLQQRAGVNALFPFIYTHIPRRAGQPSTGFHGGNYAIPHMQYYKDIPLTYEDMRAPEFGDVDVFARLIPAARKRGIKTFAWIIEDNRRPSIPHWEPLYEIDFHGRRTDGHPSGPCYNNPQYRAYLLGLVEDYARSYEIDGIMWGSERQGGLLNALGAYHNGERADPGQATCFCEFCQKKAKDMGLDAERARRGFGELESFVRNGRANKRPRDGYFVSFWRILLNYPELLAWENLWVMSRHEVQLDLYRKIKSIKPALLVGWHTWHNLSFSPFHRAEEDFAEMAAWSDFIRPVLYSNCAGERIHSFVDSTHGNVFGDVPPGQTLDLLYRLLDYQEAPYDKVVSTGLSADYVLRETRRTVEDVAGSATQVWPGIDIDVPVPAGASHCTPESVKQEVLAAFKGGAHGVILSRNYVEMKPENLAGAGAALRELGVH